MPTRENGPKDEDSTESMARFSRLAGHVLAVPKARVDALRHAEDHGAPERDPSATDISGKVRQPNKQIKPAG